MDDLINDGFNSTLDGLNETTNITIEEVEVFNYFAFWSAEFEDAATVTKIEILAKNMAAND